MLFCEDPGVLRVFLIVKTIFTIVLTLLPIIVIIFTSIDIFKSVIGSKPSEDLKNSIYQSGKRILAALIVFFIPTIISFIFSEIIPEDTSLNQCFTNAELGKIEKYTEKYEAKLEAEKEAAKKAKEEAIKKREEEEKKKNEEIRENIEANNQNNSGNSTGITSELSGGNVNNSANGNMKAKQFNGSKTMQYWELVPPNVSNNPALIIFLHGTGECGNMNKMLNAGMSQYMNKGYYDNYDAIFIAPNTKSCSWSSDSAVLKELIDTVVQEHNVDRNHIIITGHSLGGVGVWNMIAKYQGFFSAAVPISGCAFESVTKYVGTPIRNYVGASEDTYIKCTYPVVNNINKNGGNAEYYTLESPYNTHSSVIQIYKDAELINWMLRQ